MERFNTPWSNGTHFDLRNSLLPSSKLWQENLSFFFFKTRQNSGAYPGEQLTAFEVTDLRSFFRFGRL